MRIFHFLQSPGGLAFLHFTQTLLFALMVYILSAEYLRTKRRDLVYKLVASGSITLINLAKTLLLVLEVFYGIVATQMILPLLFNAVFAIIVLALARAFVFDFVLNKEVFSRRIHLGMMSVVVGYVIMQVYWLIIYEKGMIFGQSYLQLAFSLFFLVMLGFSIFFIVRFRKSYRGRLAIAFFSIVVAQLVNIYGALVPEVPGVLKILRSAAPILVPAMFGSVVFKELIENVVTMVKHMKQVIDYQRGLVFDLVKMGADLSDLSDQLVSMSLNGWQKLSSVVKNIYAQEEDREKFISLSTEIVTSVKSFQSRERMSENIIEDTIIKYKKGEIKLNNEATTTSKLMNDSLEKLTNGRNIIEGVTDTVLSLNQRMGRIVDIVNEIESISDMTNMLALNASIEAARAGEQGKGFSVVAEEVSKLADQSQQSTGKIAEVIRGLIADVENVNNVIYRANDDIARGVAEFSRINKYIEDTALTAVLYERIISRERSHEREMKEREIAIMQNVNESMGIVEKNQDHGNEMKESISNHIREIEAIAGISDELNGLIQDLNTKTNQMISKAEVLQGLTEVKYEKGKTKK